MWKNAEGWANEQQSYLETKGVKSYGVKVDKDGRLLIPGRDTSGSSTPCRQSAQLVRSVPQGGKKGGMFHTIDPKREQGEQPTLIAEGYATAASVHMATGLPVHVAFDASNLEPVAEALKERHPDQSVLIVGDNDHPNEKKDWKTQASKSTGRSKSS